MAKTLKPIRFAKTALCEYYSLYASRASNLYTVYFKTPSCGRGEYAEEIDVWADTPTQAKRIALSVIAAEYGKDRFPARISLRQSNVRWQAPVAAKGQFAVGDLVYVKYNGRKYKGQIRGELSYDQYPVMFDGGDFGTVDSSQITRA